MAFPVESEPRQELTQPEVQLGLGQWVIYETTEYKTATFVNLDELYKPQLIKIATRRTFCAQVHRMVVRNALEINDPLIHLTDVVRIGQYGEEANVKMPDNLCYRKSDFEEATERLDVVFTSEIGIYDRKTASNRRSNIYGL